MSNPGDGDATPITSIRQLADHIAAGCKPRGDWRIGTEHEKFGFRQDDLATAALSAGRRPAGRDPRPADRNAALRRHPDRRPRQHHRPEAGRRGGLAGTGRAARTVRRAAGDAARDQGRDGRRISPRCAAVVPGPADRLRAARLPSAGQPRRHAVDAERPLRHHAPLHAEGRQPRPRHDDAHLYRAGEPRLRLRSRHGAQAARRAAAAAAGDRAVRQLAVHRGQAERLPVLPRPGLDRHRQRPLRHSRR